MGGYGAANRPLSRQSYDGLESEVQVPCELHVMDLRSEIEEYFEIKGLNSQENSRRKLFSGGIA